ncbi:MAG: hypothetical protein IPO40_08245 [Fibrobacteres bacterium]|nr:hypothetical protein [Fibrobacterota bacterium]
MFLTIASAASAFQARPSPGFDSAYSVLATTESLASRARTSTRTESTVHSIDPNQICSRDIFCLHSFAQAESPQETAREESFLVAAVGR